MTNKDVLTIIALSWSFPITITNRPQLVHVLLYIFIQMGLAELPPEQTDAGIPAPNKKRQPNMDTTGYQRTLHHPLH